MFTIPRVFYETYINIKSISRQEGYTIEKKELEAFDFLKNKTDKKSLILVDYRSFGSDAEAPYISVMSNRSSYLSGMGNELTAHGIDYLYHKKNVDSIFGEKAHIAGKLLLTNNIDYIIMSNSLNLAGTESAYFLRPVFRNEKFKVLEFSEELAREYLKNDWKNFSK